MKKTAALLVFLFLPVLAEAREESWAFIRSVGGLAIGQPQREGQGWNLPVTADLSGLHAVSEQPVALNSALSCARVETVIEGANLYLTVISGPVGPGANARCPVARLGRIGAGRYTVFYRSGAATPVHLGEISISP